MPVKVFRVPSPLPFSTLTSRMFFRGYTPPFVVWEDLGEGSGTCTTIRHWLKGCSLSADMSYLDELAANVQSEGSFTTEWATIRQLCFPDGCLEKFPGRNNMQKLRAWAASQRLTMDFDLEFGNFSADIRAVTFWNGRQDGDGDSDQADSAQEHPDAAQAVVDCSAGKVRDEREYFDWDAVDCR